MRRPRGHRAIYEAAARNRRRAQAAADEWHQIQSGAWRVSTRARGEDERSAEGVTLTNDQFDMAAGWLHAEGTPAAPPADKLAALDALLANMQGQLGFIGSGDGLDDMRHSRMDSEFTDARAKVAEMRGGA